MYLTLSRKLLEGGVGGNSVGTGLVDDDEVLDEDEEAWVEEVWVVEGGDVVVKGETVDGGSHVT